MTPALEQIPDRLRDAAETVAEDYARPDSESLRGYVTVLGVYAGVVGGLTAWARHRGVRPPERIPIRDLALLAVATHKVSRTVTKDSVTSPLRAPFTRFKGSSAPAELKEEVRGSGVRKAMGELLTCPFCFDQWTATGFVAGMVVAPRATRLLASTFAVRAGADALHYAYAKLQKSDG